MASGDNRPKQPKYMTYSKCKLPLVGALIDYMDTSFEYFWRRTFVNGERLNAKTSRSKLSATFMAGLCLLVGFVANVKMEVVTFDEKPLQNDLHFMLMSKDEDLYVDDIDVSRILWCIEASDCVVLLISCLLVWNSSNVQLQAQSHRYILTGVGTTWALDMTFVLSMFIFRPTRSETLLRSASIVLNVRMLVAYNKFGFQVGLVLASCCIERSPLSEYLFLPWLGMTLRGLFLRQAPTVGALVYTILMVDGSVSPLFVTAFSFLFLIESRLCLEVGRVVRARWERRGAAAGVDEATPYELETLWSNDDVHSVEVRNYVY